MYRQLIEPNLDPVIRQPNGKGGSYALTNWVGWCLAYVATAFKSGWAGTTAWEAWNMTTKRKHLNKDFPTGVKLPIWFSGFSGAGHVAILEKAPNGKVTIWTSPYKKNQPTAEIVNSIEQLERDLAQYNVKYVGWSEDIGGNRVIESNGKVLGTMSEDINLVDDGGFRTLTDAFYNNPNPTPSEVMSNVGKPWKQVIHALAVSEGRKKHVEYLQRAAAFYEKHKDYDFSKNTNPKADKLFEAVKEAVKE